MEMQDKMCSFLRTNEKFSILHLSVQCYLSLFLFLFLKS